jgi:DNA polymerase I-like protein with 3'-5' exonuclease and polymerase domains
MIRIDLETKPIGPRPEHYPPEPVGLAFRHDDRSSGYLAWGHSTNNTPDGRRKAEALLRQAFRGNFGTVMMHNGPFDIEVAMAAFGVEWPTDWGDTMYLAFLNNPREINLKLKPLAETYLGRKTTAKDRLDAWITENIQEITPDGRTRKIPASRTGEFIWRAPGDLAGRYAMQDVEMTGALAKELRRRVEARGPRMMEAYDREVELAPITVAMEQGGVRVDLKRLRRFEPVLAQVFADLAGDIKKRLGGRRLGADFNPSSGAQLGAALKAAGKLSREVLTPTGKQSTRMDVLIETCADAKLVEQLHLYSVAEKYLGGFVRPWIASAERNDGYINPHFNQVRSTEEGYGGTRTGRYSSSDPNLQQVPADIAESKNGVILTKFAALLAKPAYGVKGFLGLRDFFIPDPGAMWVSLDYNQQELRILAHFERGKLMHEYLKNPALDVHSWIRDMVRAQTGVDYPRKFIKTVVFGILYGMGKAKLGKALGIDEVAAATLKNNVLNALPGVRRLMDATRGTITTWGGRVYDVEPARYVLGPLLEDGTRDEGQEFNYDFKQLNTLIQGSAADCTKQGMIQIQAAVPKARIALQVHDEIVIQASSMREVSLAAEAMCDLAFNVPLTTKPKVSRATWARCG